jgi:small GTP-binding protein
MNAPQSNTETYIINRTPMYKIIVLGESNVGKTSLIKRFVEDTFPLDYKTTVGVDYKIKCVNINETQAAKLSIWDTAGQERYRSIARSYLNNAQGIIICYDISDRNSFVELANFWINFAQSYALKSICRLIIVGTKLDKKMNRKVTYEEGKKLADDLGVSYFETSAMKNLNVSEVFMHLTKEVHKTIEEYEKIKEKSKDQDKLFNNLDVMDKSRMSIDKYSRVNIVNSNSGSKRFKLNCCK